MKNFTFVTLLLATLLISCQTSTKEKVETPDETTVFTKIDTSFVGLIESAHQKEKFLSHEAIQYDFNLLFGGKERMNGRFTLLTNSTKALIELKNGSKMLYIHDKSYHTADMEPSPKIRFDVYTWPYFFLFPYKLSDEGTVWSDYTSEDTTGLFDTKKLSFESGIGDDPDDWYILYKNKATNLIDHAAYIVTANKTVEEAESKPSAIQYLKYEEIDGVPFATEWVFWYWLKDQGLTKSKGNGQVTNIQFVDLEDDFFSPDGMVEIK
ncbi:MAG: hypothetical protein R2728_04625 [Chitinophagales bacterium]